VREYEVDEEGSAAGGGGEGGGGGESKTLKKGWLEKRGELNTAWKTRFFVLSGEDLYRDTPKTLRYYKDEETARIGKSGGAIECGAACVTVKTSESVFELTTPTRTYVLAAKSEAEVDEWVALISAPEGGDEDAPGASAVTGTRDHAESVGLESMASFTQSGPLNEVYSGMMLKKGQGMSFMGGKMQRRYFVLYDNHELHYFEGSTMDSIKRKGRIALKEATGLQRTKPDDRKDFTFVIKAPGRDWVLDPGSAALWQEWESKLRPMIGGND
jgi:hypothetical protein